MLLERRRGQVGAQIAVEAAHERIYGKALPYFEIAADIYAAERSQERVAGMIARRYDVTVSAKTAGSWVNRGIEQRKGVPA